MLSEHSPREQLENRVQKRFEQMGMPDSSAERMSKTAVRHFYNGQPDHHRDIVSAEAFVMLQSTLIPALAQFRSMAANALEAVRQMWSAIEPMVELADKAQEPATPRAQPFSLSEIDVAIDTGNGFEPLKGVRSVELMDDPIRGFHPEDRITGAPHHYIINGDHSECGCGGHSPECEIYNIPAWTHKPSICVIPRTLCTHRPKHTYGQPCTEYHENLADLVKP